MTEHDDAETEAPDTFVVLDSIDVDAQASFWAAALGYRRVDQLEQYVVLVPRQGNTGPVFLVQGVSDSKQVKNRMHVDLHFSDPEAHAERLVGLGATRLGEEPVGRHRVDHDGRSRGQRVRHRPALTSNGFRPTTTPTGRSVVRFGRRRGSRRPTATASPAGADVACAEIDVSCGIRQPAKALGRCRAESQQRAVELEHLDGGFGQLAAAHRLRSAAVVDPARPLVEDRPDHLAAHRCQ